MTQEAAADPAGAGAQAPAGSGDAGRRAELADLRLAEDEEGILACVHCGFCLQACPTYRVLGDENDSPRGRIYLMRALVEGRLESAEGAFATHIDRCLGCRACETACPAGVEYGSLLERARADRTAAAGGPGATTRVLLWIFRSDARTRLFLAAGRLLRATGIAGLLGGLLPGRAGLAMRLLASTRPERDAGAAEGSGAGAAASPARRAGPDPVGEEDGGGDSSGRRFALLEGCVMEGLFGHVNDATRRALAAHGYRPVGAPGQGCCGALHAHAGLEEEAHALARENIRAFEESDADWIAVNSAGCGAAMREYPEWMAGDPVWVGRARRLADGVRDVTELLEDAPARPRLRLPGRVAYDAPCHLLHGQGVEEEPIAVLERIEELEVDRLPSCDRCCGGAGIYNLLQADLSAEVLAPKLEEIEAEGPRWVATGNPGCLMQVGAGLLQRGAAARAVHPVELVARALTDGGGRREAR